MRHCAPERAALAAANNAAWCDAVCRALGGRCTFDGSLWVHHGRSPRFYPNAITVESGDSHAPSRIAALSVNPELADGWTVKDSFAEFDLVPLGFEPMFDAQWVWRDADRARPRGPTSLAWCRVQDDAALAEWKRASGATGDATRPAAFVPALLDEPGVDLWSGLAPDGHVVCGVASNTGPAAVVGISNLFALPEAPADWRAQVVAAVAARHPDRALLGYDAGTDLAELLALGFDAVGPLRVWRHAARS